jgi:hypothetical protein
MNSVNASVGFSNFQIRLGRSPHLIPPIVPPNIETPTSNDKDILRAKDLIDNLNIDIAEAKDNLLEAKIFQAHYTNQKRSPEIPFQIGDKVMLSTYTITRNSRGRARSGLLKTTNYTLDLPNSPNTYPTYHASELKPYLSNDADLFPSCELNQPQPILTPDGLEEYFVQEIIDSHRRGKGWQYLVRWTGYGPEHD